MKYCENCGAEIADDDVFCGECGTSIEKKDEKKVTETTRETIPQESNINSKEKNSSSNPTEKPRSNMVIIGIIAIVAIGIVCFIFKSVSTKNNVETIEETAETDIQSITDINDPGAIGVKSDKSTEEPQNEVEKEKTSESVKNQDEGVSTEEKESAADVEEQQEKEIIEERFDWESALQGGDKGWLCITDDFVTDLEKHNYYVRFDGRVTLDDGNIYHQYSFGDDEPLYFVGENVKKVWKYYDYGYDLIVGDDTETNNNAGGTSEYLFENSDSVKLDDDMWLNVWDDVIVMEEKQGLTLPSGKPLSQMVINEIYARHGYIFKSKELQEFFEERSWYNPVTNDMSQIDNELNDIEKYNISFLKQAKE